MGACSDKINTPSSDTNYFEGSVILYGGDGAELPYRNGVFISIEGTERYTMTNSDGHWKIPFSTPGTYNIIASKEGFGYHKFMSYYYDGEGSTYFRHTLTAPPSYSIDSVTFSADSNGVTFFAFTSDSVNYYRYSLFYFGKVPPVYDAIETWNLGGETRCFPTRNIFYYGFFYREFRDVGFTSGDTLYGAVYPCASNFQKYFSTENSRVIYTSGVGLKPIRFIYVIP